MTTDDTSVLAKKIRLPKIHVLEKTLEMLSPAERLLFWILAVVLTGSVIATVYTIQRESLTTIPDYGGSITEGIIGSPRFINPLLTLSDADRDLTTLIFSGLLHATPEGALEPSLAESFSISEDGREYTFIIREDAVFHDGVPVTAADVLFTVHMAQNPALKSPKRADWEGVLAEQISDREIRFSLPRPYAPFLENATLGILPKHLWEGISAEEFSFSDLNTYPVGSGPYKIKKVKQDSTGIPRSYTLTAFSKYTLGRPFIKTITIVAYKNEDALVTAWKRNDIDTVASISPQKITEQNIETKHIIESSFPRIFAVFFNHNRARVFGDKSVREALDIALNKDEIVAEVLHGYGTALHSPIPPTMLATYTPTPTDTRTRDERLEEARVRLRGGGWTFDEEAGVWKNKETLLSFTLATASTAELKAAANAVVREWRALGVAVDIAVFETGELNQNIIRPREYDALLFGEIVGRELDLFAFWHSSQRNDPGLNIALYTNKDADSLLSEARGINDRENREEKYTAFEKIVQEDTPAVFLYSPAFIYIIGDTVSDLSLSLVSESSDRFSNVHLWYVESDPVWHFFDK